MKIENCHVDFCMFVCLWTWSSCFLHFWFHFLRGPKMMLNEIGRIMVMELKTLDKLAQGPIDEDICKIPV